METLGSGPPVLFAHGLSGNRARSLREVQPLLPDHRLVVFDQRGHGDSTPIHEHSLYDAGRMAGDIAAVLDSVGIERAVVAGESMGAATAALFAQRWPERVERLLLVGPAYGPEPNPERQRLIGLGLEIEREGLDSFLSNSARRLREVFGAPPGVVAEVGRMQRAHDPMSLATAFRTVSEWTLDPDLSSLAGKPGALLVLGWEADPLHPMALARALAAKVPGAVFTELPGWMAVFEDPEMVGRAFRAFLVGAAASSSRGDRRMEGGHL